MAKSLNKLGYPFKPASIKPEDYRPMLVVIAGRSRTKKVELEQMIKEYKAKTAKATANKAKPKREYFEMLLVEVEKMQGTTYDLDVMPTAKFIVLEKKYWAYVERVNNKNRK